MPLILEDALTVIFWSITYLLIVIAGFHSRKTKKISMPYSAGVLNLAWEICALYWIEGFLGYALWLAIDLAIVYWGFRFLDSTTKRIVYVISIIICTIVMFWVFNTIPNGFVYSVYLIDLQMAICYLVERKKISSVFKIPIAITKLLGDLFAGFVFRRYIITVVIAILVFVCNCIYLYYCIAEKKEHQKQKSVVKHGARKSSRKAR